MNDFQEKIEKKKKKKKVAKQTRGFETLKKVRAG
jgi:hypothetical protein